MEVLKYALVNVVDNKLVCISLDVMRMRLPVYASGARNRLEPETKGIDYAVVLEFAETIKQVTELSERSEEYWYELSKHKNELVSQWAVWELLQTHGASCPEELKSICVSEEVYPMAQAIADDALQSTDKQWRSSQERQAMVARWLTLKRPMLNEVTLYYLGLYDRLWRDTCGYDRALLYEQVQQAIATETPGTPEWHHLNRLSQRLARYLNDGKAPPAAKKRGAAE